MNWVQVRHRLPEMGKAVLILGNETNIAALEYDCAWRCINLERNICKKVVQFRSARGEQFETWNLDEITHWAYIEGPK